MIENRAITAFAKGMEAHDMNQLMKLTSDDFKNRALRTADSLEDFKIVNLPKGNTTVVEVEEISKDKKRVTVQVGENKKEIFYELTREESGKWVVDDIYLKQKKKGIEAYKSVSEQMDLILTVREFLDAWSSGDREQVLEIATPKFRTELAQLPPAFLAQVTTKITHGRPKGGTFNPKASMDDKVAYVTLPRSVGETGLSMELRKGRWMVADVAIACKDEEEKLPSVRLLASSVNRCIAFLTAYESEDKAKLNELCAAEFFNGSLSLADLKQVKLPDAQLPDHELKVQLRGSRADFTLRNPEEFVQIDMRRQEGEPGEYLVSDVTIYEVASKQEKRLSALFTAQGMLEVFIEGLASRQLEAVKHCSTQDFNQRVWSKINDITVAAMPLEAFDSKDVQYQSASYQGALTKVEVKQGGMQFVYLLTDEGGRFMVDDIQWQAPGVPASVKATLEVLIPIQDFASGITLGRDPDEQSKALEMVQRNSSDEFNRMVWSQSQFIPSSGMSADTFLQAPLKSMAISDKEVTVQLGDEQYGAKVALKREHNRFIVDDVVLVAGVQDSERLALRHALRSQLATGEAKAPTQIMQASHESAAPDRKVEKAVYVVPATPARIREQALTAPRKLSELDADPFEDELVPVELPDMDTDE